MPTSRCAVCCAAVRVSGDILCVVCRKLDRAAAEGAKADIAEAEAEGKLWVYTMYADKFRGVS